MNIRIGNGYDIHRLVTGRPLILGGVEIAHTVGDEKKVSQFMPWFYWLRNK